MKRKVKRFQEGGLGYEEAPKPGKQSDKKSSGKKPGTRMTASRGMGASSATPSRRVSSMEFIKKYETSDPSKRVKEEAETTVERTKSGLPGDRSTAFREQRGIAKGAMDIDQKDVDRALKSMKTVGEAAAATALGQGLSVASKANLPLRLKQMLRRRATEKANAAEAAADKAGEAARTGMSRRGIPRYDERYRASSEGSDRRAAYADELPEGLKFKRGGAVKSSASSRADGIAKRGKTKGRMI
jgi:hypothetical protein